LRGRALFLVEDLSVPLNRRVWQECRALHRAGFEIEVISPRGVTHDVAPYELREGIRIHRYRLDPATGGPAGYVKEYLAALWHTWRLARALVRESPFDVVHACNPPDLLLFPVAHFKRFGTKFIFDQHDLVPELYLSRFRRTRGLGYLATLLLERFTLALADIVISTNESYKTIALTRGHKSPEDVFVVRSAPDLTCFIRNQPDVSLKRGKPYLLVYLGVMGPQDGVDHAIHALDVLSQERDDWHAIFVGDGDAAEDMKQLTRNLKLENRIEFTGRIPDEDLIVVLSTADVCLAPDPKNPLNDVSTMNKIVEYMAMSRPIVSYDLKEARASAADAAIYASPNDSTDFARCIDLLLDDAARRGAMGAEGLRRLQEGLSWEHSERVLLRAYERALGLDSGTLSVRRSRERVAV
jgi:glycosyltransferase involved in cell wall biosynthesis